MGGAKLGGAKMGGNPQHHVGQRLQRGAPQDWMALQSLRHKEQSASELRLK